MKYDAEQVYQPAEDTYLLIHAAEDEVRPDDRVCEIGCGSGAVCASLLGKCANISAVDINPHAVACSCEKGVPAVLGDMFSPFSSDIVFDLILFNAPYLPTRPEERIDDWLEYALDGGMTGRTAIEKFLPEASAHLSLQGRILLLISSLTGLSEVLMLCKENGLLARILTEEMQEDRERLIVLRIVRDISYV